MKCLFPSVWVWLCVTMSVLFTACGSEGGSLITPPDEPGEQQQTVRTVLVYFAADNSLTQYARQDIEEIKMGLSALSVEGVRLLAYIDLGDGDARLVEYVRRNGSVEEEIIHTYGERNSVGVEETREVFSAVFNNPDYEADSYALVYWSHADGWVPFPVPSSRWIGQDTGEGDNRMILSDFVSILEGMPHFDCIYFDACFMQSVEVAYALRNFTDFYIASPTETPGTGAPYECILPALLAKGGAVELADIYYQTYLQYYDGTARGGYCTEDWTAGAAICVLSTSALEQLASVTNRLLPEESVSVEDLRAASFNYDRRTKTSSAYVGYYDWEDMMRALLSSESYAVWKQTFDEAVVYWATTPMNFFGSAMRSMEGTDGVSHYIPESLSSPAAEAYRATEWYAAAGLGKLGW